MIHINNEIYLGLLRPFVDIKLLAVEVAPTLDMSAYIIHMVVALWPAECKAACNAACTVAFPTGMLSRSRVHLDASSGYGLRWEAHSKQAAEPLSPHCPQLSGRSSKLSLDRMQATHALNAAAVDT